MPIIPIIGHYKVIFMTPENQITYFLSNTSVFSYFYALDLAEILYQNKPDFNLFSHHLLQIFRPSIKQSLFKCFAGLST